VVERLRTLIVEDSESDAELLVRHLKRNGYDVVHQRVQTAQAFAAALRAHEWDVILSDYSMPDFDVATALRILKDGERDVPFIIVSGIVGDETAAAAMRAGAHDFFLKDRLDRLPSAIERELGDARVRLEKRNAIELLKESERQLRTAVKARDEFLSIASHELRTPLTPLVLQLEATLAVLRTSRRAGAPPPVANIEARLETAVRAVGRVTMLINRLLDVTMITSDALTVSPTQVDLGALVEDVVRSMSELASRAGSPLIVTTHEPVTGLWDPAGLETIVTNLLSNAIKFGCGKPIEVEVGRQTDSACLTVVDHGIGIPLDAQQRIFERFERAVPTRHYGGFGVGLWVARQIVRAHGGDISITSAPDTGSTFVVTLPIAIEVAA
jgi:signal transduction histidine kinase